MEKSIFAGLMDVNGGAAQVTLAVSLLSLIAVWWPLMHGTLLCWRARAATRVPEPGASSERVVQPLEGVKAAALRDHDAVAGEVKRT